MYDAFYVLPVLFRLFWWRFHTTVGAGSPDGRGRGDVVKRGLERRARQTGVRGERDERRQHDEPFQIICRERDLVAFRDTARPISCLVIVPVTFFPPLTRCLGHKLVCARVGIRAFPERKYKKKRARRSLTWPRVVSARRVGRRVPRAVGSAPQAGPPRSVSRAFCLRKDTKGHSVSWFPRNTMDERKKGASGEGDRRDKTDRDQSAPTRHEELRPLLLDSRQTATLGDAATRYAKKRATKALSELVQNPIHRSHSSAFEPHRWSNP